MKNDIDAILDSMFRGGRLHFKKQPAREREGGEAPHGAPCPRRLSRRPPPTPSRPSKPWTP